MPPRCPVRPCPPSPAGRGGGCSRCSADPAPLPLRSGSAALACGTCALGGAVLTPEHDTARGSRSHTGPTGPDPNRPWPGAGVGWPGREWRPLPPARLSARRRRQQRTGIPALAQRKLALKRARYRKADDKKWEGRLT